jgi:hypothetical protein
MQPCHANGAACRHPPEHEAQHEQHYIYHVVDAGGDDLASQLLVVATRQQTTTSSPGHDGAPGRNGLACSSINGHTTCTGGGGGGGGGDESFTDSGSTASTGKMGEDGQQHTAVVRSALSCTTIDGRTICRDADGRQARLLRRRCRAPAGFVLPLCNSCSVRLVRRSR